MIWIKRCGCRASCAIRLVMTIALVGLVSAPSSGSARDLPEGRAIARMLQGGEWRGGQSPLFSSRKVQQGAFSASSVERDWVAEGPVKWQVKQGALQLESVLTEDFILAYRQKNFFWIPGQGMQDYFQVLEGLAKKKLSPEIYQRCLDSDGKFKGGHVVMWNKKPLPENYVIEFDAAFKSEMGLFILFFSAEKIGGGSIFDPQLAARSGVFSQYTRGDIQSYHISSYTPQRGTANVRKNPGGRLLQKNPDWASLAPGLKYRYRLVKWGNRFQYYLNDQLQADVIDQDGEVLSGGHAGLRLMAGCRASFANYSVSELLESPFLIQPPAKKVMVRGLNKPADVKDLQSICDAAEAGTTIVLPEGELADVELNIRSKGTATKPIVIVAGDKTWFTGRPQIVVSGSWITLRGFRFQKGTRPDNSDLVTRKGNKVGGQLPPIVRIHGDHNRLTDCHIDGFDKHHNVWLWVKGRHNRVDHCSFVGKRTHGSILNVDPTPDGAWHRIDHNYFSRPNIRSDAASVIRVGNGHIEKQPGNICIEHNLFDRCDGENEIVSDKCSANIFRYNTFRDSMGGLSLRHGSRTHVYANWFVRCRSGIMIRHGGHLIENNQFDLPDSPAIELSRGQPVDFVDWRSHVQAHDSVIRRNSFWLGSKPAFTVPEVDKNKERRKVVTPESLTIEKNLLFAAGSGQFWSGQLPTKSIIRENVAAGFPGDGRLQKWHRPWQMKKTAEGAFMVSSKKLGEGYGSRSAIRPPLRQN